MRLSELSDRSGVSVASLKFYLREGLLPPGADSGTGRQASYGEAHLHRVRLIRALVDSGGLSIAGTRSVLSTLDRQSVGWHELLGTAQYALSEPVAPADEDGAAAEAEVQGLLACWGWQVTHESPVRRELAAALAGVRAGGIEVRTENLDSYAAAMRAVAEVDLSTVPLTTPEAALRQVVLGTVLVEPLLLALRKLAQEDVSRTTLEPPPR